FGLMAGVCLYSLRKYVHKLGISPEFRMKVPFAKLEEAERLLNDLRRRVLTGAVSVEADVETEADRILRACGRHKVCRARGAPSEGPGPRFLVSVVNTEPLGRMRRWLHFHVYLGLASGVVLYVHGGGSLASPLGATMNVLALLVIATGAVGTVLFAI